MKQVKRLYSILIIFLILILSLSVTGCRSRHVSEGFGNAIWESEDPYFYWYENVSYKRQLYMNNPDYQLPEDASEEEILSLYGKMEVNGKILYVIFTRLDRNARLYGFRIDILKTNAAYISGEYTYRKVDGQSYDYEVNLTVKHAYKVNGIDDHPGLGWNEEIDLPFESFTIYVTCVK